ncbi:MAG: MBL fold metallo-hydrolase [Oscillospiraceae bacterium]|nr:MBL fold metallo-hydrolase [Oscillospiraceae bacterium]
MGNIFYDKTVPSDKVALWFLGQAGYYIKSGDCSILIDPYLSDCVSKVNPLFLRRYPVPVDPAVVKADIFIVTHDHLDHLDPETIEVYSHKDSTIFVGPRFAAKKLAELGIPDGNIQVVDSGETLDFSGVRIEGVFALPTGSDVLDTTGYLLTFANGKTVYHTSDTEFCDLLLKACPNADVLLTCINGKFGNLNIADAVKLTAAVNPRYVIPNHYDVMEFNAEHPESFRFFCSEADIAAECVILQTLECFTW